MQRLLSNISIRLDERLFVKDPTSSHIGQEILRESIGLIAREGLEGFTFKKLATAMSSTESTIYRYFHNKQQLMMYLASWYWHLVEWKIVFSIANIDDPVTQLNKALETLSMPMEDIRETQWINESRLQDIVVSESFKAFVVKSLDKQERQGYFLAFEQLISRVASLISACNKDYPYPRALASTLVETAHHQSFLEKCIPELTDIGKTPASLSSFLKNIAFTALDRP